MTTDDEFPPGWWTLEFSDGELLLTTPTGARFPIGDVLDDKGGRLELGPSPDCGASQAGGSYTWPATDGEVTLTATEDDSCADRQDVLTGGAWEPTTSVPRIDEVPEPVPAPVTATIPLPAQPLHAAVLDGSLWVTAERDPTVYGIDPATNAVATTVTTGSYQDEFRWLASGEGSLWVSLSHRMLVSRIDPATGASTDIPVGDLPTGALAAHGAVWVSNHHDGTVSRIDPTNNAVTDTITVGDEGVGGPQMLAAVEGGVDVAVPIAGQIRRIDADTLEVETFYSGRTGGTIATNDAGTWIMEGFDATWVTRIGADGLPDLLVGVGDGRRPRELVTTDDAVWVVTVGDETPSSRVEVVRVDARTGEVTHRYDVSAHHEGRLELAVGHDGDIWVTTGTGIARIDTPAS